MSQAYKQADRTIATGGDYLSQAQLDQITPESLVQHIRDLQPLMASEAANAEANRKPSANVWQALRDSGLFYLFVPKARGGLEFGFDTFIDAGVAIAEVDPSTAWAATFCTEHNWIFTQFPKEAQDALWGGDFPYIIAPFVSVPPGIATKVDGGYRVSGHWKWGTGVMYADWVMCNVLHMQEGQPPQVMVALLPAADVEVPDTWHASGMAGTGSNDIVVKDKFVPEHFVAKSLARGGSLPEGRLYDAPIYGAPILPFLAMSAAIPALGAARGMLKMVKARITTYARPGAERMADRQSAQIRLAKADTLIRSAEILIRDGGRQMLQVGALAEPEQTNARLALRAQFTQAVLMCKEAALLLAEGSGTTVMLLDNAFQRNLRDILVVATHVVFDVDLAFEQHGRGLVGLAPNTPLN